MTRTYKEHAAPLSDWIAVPFAVMVLLDVIIIAIYTIAISGFGLVVALPIWGTLIRIR